MSAAGPDAIVVGAGPNGLSAAVELARAGRSVVVYEAGDTIGGGTRSAELTAPGFLHDVCSAVHPFIHASPFFKDLGLESLGVDTAHPELPFAHPLPDGSAAVFHRSVEETAVALGADGRAYRRLMGPLVDAADALVEEILGPLRVPRHPISLMRFWLKSILSAKTLARRFEGEHARALVAGVAAHGMLPLTRPPTGGFALFLMLLAHSAGWPVSRGGSQRITQALADRLTELGGRIVLSTPVLRIEDLPRADAYLFNVTPRQLVAIAGSRLPERYTRALRRYRYGPGVFKMDWALSESVPWKAEECRKAGTIHIGGPFEAIAESERETNAGRHPERPYVLLAQPTLVDPGRAPEGKHTLWAYSHVPSGSSRDMSHVMEAQIESYAPGFKDTIIARSTRNAVEMEAYNSNYVGGDINGGVQDVFQHFTRPVARISPYTTPNKSIYICSSSTPPGGGVHGMCGYFAARAALKRVLR
ncbi:MAG TPA: NAD(P)/FAD-dependent oxidoreductase [Actinomycetota bacterium]|nr:NAD(P)/FAD-dependent oxidoreductase [Actinomycetota bacterium]